MATMLSRKAVATARPVFPTSRRSFAVRASAEQEPTHAAAPQDAPIAGVTVQAAQPVPVAVTPAAPTLFGEL